MPKPAKKPAAKKPAAKKMQVDRGPAQEKPKQIDGFKEVTSASEDKQEHAARQLHNERTGGGEVREGELQAQRDEHNARTQGFKY